MNRSTFLSVGMPDNKGSLATPPWDTKEYLTNHILQHQYRVVANEWDVLYSYFFDYPGAIFATTIRNPLDRWYSQYRFEHLGKLSIESMLRTSTESNRD